MCPMNGQDDIHSSQTIAADEPAVAPEPTMVPESVDAPETTTTSESTEAPESVTVPEPVAKTTGFKAAPRNTYKIFLLGILKLAWNGLLIFLLYDRLKTFGIYDDVPELYLSLKDRLGGLTYRDFLLAGAAVSAILYMLALTQIRIRNRSGYALFAVLFVLDGFILLMPTVELVTVAFCILLLLLLRLKSNWRYLACALLVVVYALLLSPYALLVIPVYAIVRLWQKDANWGIRVAIVLILAFCVLYQAGYLMFLLDLRPETSNPYLFDKIFATESYPGHASYYLIDYLSVLARLLLPYGLLTNGLSWSMLYAVVAVGLTIFLIYNMYYLLTLDWKQPMSRDNRLLADVTAIFLILFATHAIYEQGYVAFYRHLFTYYPLLLYLFFGANRRAPKPQLERDFTGTRPVIFFHKGADDYVYDVLDHAGKVCGHRNIVLLGDESNRGYTSNWYSFDDYCKGEAEEFAQIYNHISETSYEFELTCFQRHFALYAFMQEKGIEECFLCDSDVLIYENLSELPLDDIDFGCSSANYSVCLGECASPHCTYWSSTRLRQFLDFVIHVYKARTDWLMDVSKKQKEELADGNITDMILLTAWRKIVDDYDANFRYRNFDRIEDGHVFDHRLSSPDNLVTNEYRFSKMLGIKLVRFIKKQPYLYTQDKTPIKACTLHCQDCKHYVRLLSRRKNGRAAYVLSRMLR